MFVWADLNCEETVCCFLDLGGSRTGLRHRIENIYEVFFAY